MWALILSTKIYRKPEERFFSDNFQVTMDVPGNEHKGAAREARKDLENPAQATDK